MYYSRVGTDGVLVYVSIHIFELSSIFPDAMVSIAMRIYKKRVILSLIFASCLGLGSAAGSKNFFVFPLSGSIADPSLAWLDEGIATSLSFQLQASGNSVIGQNESRDLLEMNDLPSGASLSRGSMIRIAQQTAADFVVLGTTKGSEKNLKISIWLLDLKSMKLTGEIAASGPLTALPQMENELAWLILSNSGLANTSRESFRTYIRMVPNAAYACYIKSNQTSSENERIRFLQKAVSIFSEFPSAHFQLGRLYYQKKEWANAIPHFLHGIDRNDFRLQSQFMLGNCYLQTGDYRYAISTFSPILYFSRNVEILNNLGVTYLRTQDNMSAIRFFLEAKSLANADPTILLNLAIAYFLAGNVPASRKILKDALAFHPENGLLQYFQGFMLKEHGESEQAAPVLLKAKRLGIPVEKMQSEDPRTWSRPFINLVSQKIQ
jgi:tetratricopeptide (TPR) repeat protein